MTNKDNIQILLFVDIDLTLLGNRGSALRIFSITHAFENPRILNDNPEILNV